MKTSDIIIAGIEFECTTPLSVRSGDKDVLTDSIVTKDVNMLPYIPGTAIAGIIRHGLNLSEEDDLFYFGKEDGSRIIFSGAHLIYDMNCVADGLINDTEGNKILKAYQNLPVRQHVSINELGAARKGGKYDEEIVFKGSRFYFEIELNNDSKSLLEKHKTTVKSIIDLLHKPELRIGSGSRNGYGEIKVVRSQMVVLNLQNKDEFNLYLTKSSSLNNVQWWNKIQNTIVNDNSEPNSINSEWVRKSYTLESEDFFLFGSGFGTQETDKGPVKEDLILWESGKPDLKKECLLIPASSIKGSISHRLAYNYNLINETFAEDIGKKGFDSYSGENNKAVQIVFGSSGKDKSKATRGKIIFSDIIEETKYEEKIMNHVAIDQFTGGAMGGALFNESVIYTDNKFNTTLYFHKDLFNKSKTEDNVVEALEQTIKDFENGLIPFGAGNGRGFGFFKVSLIK